MKHLHEGGCPGSRMRMLEQQEAAESMSSAPVQSVSRLRNWPVQIKLAPIHAPYFAGAKLLIAADCTAYAYANFHQEFMRGKVTLIGCPKLDAVDYSEKLTEILRNNDIQSVTILRMEVPCCGGLEMAAKRHCRPAKSSFRGRWSPFRRRRIYAVKRQYELATGRRQKNDVIAYQIRQSFRPGEITAEEANKVGYELAMRFTKGKYAFIVATHTDREHIHNHIIYNSTALDGTRKFRDFFFSALAVQRLSDLICLEHQLSVIEIKPYRERKKRTLYPPKESNRDRLCSVIDRILAEKPYDYEDFLQKAGAAGL